jgi:hypothetical protein
MVPVTFLYKLWLYGEQTLWNVGPFDVSSVSKWFNLYEKRYTRFVKTICFEVFLEGGPLKTGDARRKAHRYFP